MNLNDMSLDELVEYINKELKKDRSLKEIEILDFKVNERVVAKRLSRRGFKRIDNQYIYSPDLRQLSPSVKTDITVNQIDYTKDFHKYNNIDLDKLEDLLCLVDPIKEVIQEYNKSKNIIEVEKVELKPKAVTKVKQKMFKVDIDIANKWDNFILEHKEYKVQQLISLALEEFINKYS